MLENWRYRRALETKSKHSASISRDIFLEEEYRTQFALERLGIKNINSSPSEAAKVGSLFMSPELITDLRVPYAVEVLGMPRAGKSTVINRYLEELWSKEERNQVVLVDEGARSIKQEFGDLRYSDPYSYLMLAGWATYVDYISSLRNLNSGMRMAVSDRGQIDRRVFRRVLFGRGDVNPEIMADEDLFMHRVENTPIQVGGVIMMMIRPEESIRRSGKQGPVVNMDFLPRLYEQYWRLHWEILQGEVPYRTYTCIDAEKDEEKVYERFKYAMDTTLNIHKIFLGAIARAFPEEFDRGKAEYDKNPGRLTHAQQALGERLGRRVIIVGGDDMKSDEDVLGRPFLEGLDLRRKT